MAAEQITNSDKNEQVILFFKTQFFGNAFCAYKGLEEQYPKVRAKKKGANFKVSTDLMLALGNLLSRKKQTDLSKEEAKYLFLFTAFKWGAVMMDICEHRDVRLAASFKPGSSTFGDSFKKSYDLLPERARGKIRPSSEPAAENLQHQASQTPASQVSIGPTSPLS
jgi:hypothetical protein